MPTLKDVARHSGVSIATASAVVNGAGWVTEETRRRVQAAVEALGYRPNRLARSLKTQQSQAVGVVVSDLTNPFFTEVVRSLSHALRADGRTLFLCDADHRFDLGEAAFHTLVEKRVDALVLIGDSVHERVVADYVARPEAGPVVAIERDYGHDGVTTLLVDSEAGAYAATRHLLEAGCTRIATITGPHSGPGSTTYGRAQRFEGYRRALAEAGRPVNPAYVAEGNFRYSGGQEAMQRFLALSEPPDAVFASNDLMALGAADVARRAGLALPDDLALVGYDDIPVAALSAPGLTTLAMPKAALGQAAAEQIAAQLAGAPPVRRLFEAQLVVRGSTVAGAVPA